MSILRVQNALWGALLVLGCMGCQTSKGFGTEDLDGGSQAAGAAFITDAGFPRRPMPRHEKDRPLDFYFKHCSSVDGMRPDSRTSYECLPAF